MPVPQLRQRVRNSLARSKRAPHHSVDSLERRRLFTLPADAIELVDPATGSWISSDATPFAYGAGVQVRLKESVLTTKSPLQNAFEWNFGDTGSTSNVLHGFNAAHVYDTVTGSTGSDFTITLRVTDSSGSGAPVVDTDTITVHVNPQSDAAWHDVYVSAPTGTDPYDKTGAGTTTSPYKSLRWAVEQSQGNSTRIFLKRGETFEVDPDASGGGLTIAANNYQILSSPTYGSGDLATIVTPDTAENFKIFTLLNGARNVTLQGFKVTSKAGPDDAYFTKPGAKDFTARWASVVTSNSTSSTSNVVVRDIQALRVANLAGGSGNTQGLFVFQNTTLGNSTVAYGVYTDPGYSGTSIVANDFGNSYAESNTRTNSDYCMAEGNRLINYYDHDGVHTIRKANSLRANAGKYIYWSNNVVTDGSMTIGPLPLSEDGTREDLTVEYVVAEKNTMVSTAGNTAVAPSRVEVLAGVHHISLRNNVIETPTFDTVDSKGQAIEGGTIGFSMRTGGYVTKKATGVRYFVPPDEDINILQNTVYVRDRSSFQGAFGIGFQIDDSRALDTDQNSNIYDGIFTLRNNLYSGPTLVGNKSATTLDLQILGTKHVASSIALSDGNQWATFSTSPSTNGGLMLLGTDVDLAYYLDPQEWLALGNVGNDAFGTVALQPDYATPAATLVKIGDYLSAAPLDYNDSPRPRGLDSITPGAIQQASAATATISGKVYADTDQDGQPDAGEGGVASVGVWLDYNQNGVQDAVEPTATTDANGVFAIPNAPDGSYLVSVYNVPSGYSVSSGGGGRSVNVSNGGSVGNVYFGLAPTAQSTLPTPTNFHGTPAADGSSVALAWDATPGATHYRIDRSTDGVNYAGLYTPQTNSYTDTSVVAGTTYYYRMHASTFPSGVSSADVFATVSVPASASPPATPTGFTATLGADKLSAVLTWNASPGATAYRVERSIDGTTYASIAFPTTTTFSEAVPAGKTYYYRILASNAAGASLRTSSLSVTTPRIATNKLEAESPDASLGITTVAIPAGGQAAGHFDASDWIKFSSINFTAAGVTSFTMRASRDATSSASFSIYIDGLPGQGGTQVGGPFSVSSTGSYDTYSTQVRSLTSAIAGVHDLYLVGNAGPTGIGNIDWIQFA